MNLSDTIQTTEAVISLLVLGWKLLQTLNRHAIK